MTATTGDTAIFEAAWSHVDAPKQARFASRVRYRAGDECWIWLGGLEPDGGYSRFRSDTLGVIAGYRWSIVAQQGPLTDPVVRHRCDVRCCVRPDHLTAGTQADNIADTVRRRWWTTVARHGPRQWRRWLTCCVKRRRRRRAAR